MPPAVTGLMSPTAGRRHDGGRDDTTEVVASGHFLVFIWIPTWLYSCRVGPPLIGTFVVLVGISSK